jgi:hypothetical protein
VFILCISEVVLQFSTLSTTNDSNESRNSLAREDYKTPVYHTLTFFFFPCLFQTSKIAPFRGHLKRLFLFPIDLSGVHVTANGCWQFHSVLRVGQQKLHSTLPFPSCFLCNPKFHLAGCSACHLLSRWFLAQLIFRP